MASTTILLREDIDNLGGRGEIVKVRSGYARNFLLPQGLASVATKGNVRQIEQERAALLKKAAVEKATAEGQKEQMQAIALTFERKSGEQGHLFGSVTSMDIADALKARGYEIDRRKIALREALKEVGEFTVSVKLHREVVLEVPVTVTAEGGVIEPKTEKRPAAAESAENSDRTGADLAEPSTESPADLGNGE